MYFHKNNLSDDTENSRPKRKATKYDRYLYLDSSPRNPFQPKIEPVTWNPVILHVALWISAFCREVIAVLLYYWMKSQLGMELFYVKVISLFSVNLIMKLPYINPLAFILSIITNDRMKKANIHALITNRVGSLTTMSFIYIVMYIAAEVLGAYLAVISIMSSEFYFGRVVLQNSATPYTASGINDFKAFGRPQDISWQTCPNRDWRINNVVVGNSMKDVEVNRRKCFNTSLISPDACYTYSYLGSEDTTIITNQQFYDCIHGKDGNTNLSAYWVLNETVAVTLYLIIVIHVWSVLYDDNRRLPGADLLSQQSHYIKSIWWTAIYMSLVTFTMQVTFPFARCNPIDCIYTLMLTDIRGGGMPVLVSEMWWRMLGQGVGLCLAIIYYYTAYVNDNDGLCYVITWGEMPPDEKELKKIYTMERLEKLKQYKREQLDLLDVEDTDYKDN